MRTLTPRLSITLVTLLLALQWGGCATRSPVATLPLAGASNDAPADTASRLEISYLLGHDVYRFRFQAEKNRVLAQKYLDHERIKETEVDRIKYLDLFQRASQLISKNRKPAEAAPCRAPFTLTVQAGSRSESASGCRQSEEGLGISRLARDAEFLLYFQK